MSNNNDSVYTDLARGLAQCAKDSVNMPSPGADKSAQEQQRDAAARSLADPIYEAIKRGLHGVLFFSVDELNKIDKPLDDILYVCNDAGFLFRGLGNAQLSVTRNTFLRWNGYWELVQFSVTTIINNETGGNVRQEIENHNNAVDSHPDIRQDIINEKESRESADSSLQQQIDTITSKSDVVDVVASYAELVAYDTSALGDNDVVKVLADEMHDDAESYYRWNLTTQTWGYIGSQGPFVTPAEMQTALDGKVDKVTGKGLSTNDFTDAAKSITDNIFLATYNSTSYDDIKAAYDAGKTILCHFTDSRHTVRVATFDRLTHSTTSTSYAYFASVTKTDAYELVASKTRYGTTTTWSGTAKSWGALAEKSNVTNADISGTISDSHIASASTWNGKADKVSNATNGHLAGLDANGNLTDSGISPSDIANDIFIAEYGVTPFDDIQTAIANGKTLLCSCDWTNDYGIPKKIGHIVLPLATAQELSNEIRFCLIVKEVSTYANPQLIEVTCKRNLNTQATTWSLSATEVPNIPKNHASTTSDYGAGSENSYGHVQLTGSVTQNSTKAITSGAVYTALQGVSGAIDGKQDELNDNSLAFINKSSSGDASKFLNEQGNFVHVDGIPVQKIVVGQTLLRANDCLYSYGSNNVLYVMTSWIERRQSGAAYEMILRPINTENLSYLKVLITEQYSVYTVNGIDGYQYNKWTLEDSINTDVVLVTYKEGVINPPFDALINAVHNRRDVLLAVYLENEAQEYYRLQWWKFYNSDDIYSFEFSTYIDANHTFKSYVFDYNTGGVLQNVFPRVFSPISSVGTNNIGDGAVTNAKLANYSVTSEKLEAGAVISGKIANGAVGATKLADNAVTSPKIVDGAIDARHKYTALCEWTRDSQYSNSSLKVTTCGGSSRGGSSTTSTNKLSFILLNYGESMIFVNNTYNGTTEIYCDVEQLPKFSWLHFIICATNTTSSHKVSIVFRTNSNTTLGYYIKGCVSGSNSNYTYTLDAGECADFYLLRGEDTNGKCTLFLQRTWVANG